MAVVMRTTDNETYFIQLLSLVFRSFLDVLYMPTGRPYDLSAAVVETAKHLALTFASAFTLLFLEVLKEARHFGMAN